MGRTENLNRLALGRSAFQDLDAVTEDRNKDATRGAASRSEPDANEYVQKYDAKGRPFNPRTEIHNADLRKAQNEVLAVVHVVERRQRYDLNAKSRHSHGKDSTEEENFFGEVLHETAAIMTALATYYPNILLQRSLAGLYPADMPFAAVITIDMSAIMTAISTGAINDMFYVLLPGAWQSLAARLLPISLFLTGKSIEWVDVATYLAFDIMFLPVSHYVECSRLGIVGRLFTASDLVYTPATYGSAFISHFRRLEWHTCLSLLGLGASMALSGDSAFVHLLSLSPRPQTLGKPDQARPRFTADPLGHFRHIIQTAREALMRRLGWDMHERSATGEGGGVETDERVLVRGSDKEVDGRRTSTIAVHRSTALARFPARWLSMILDSMLCKAVFLPLEGVILRSSVRLFVQLISSNPPDARPGTSLAVFPGGVWLGGVVSGRDAHLADMGMQRASWSKAAGTLSKVGLALGLCFVVEAAMYGGFCMIARSYGVEDYGWEDESEVGRGASADVDGCA